jgi:hypothetical protein
MLVPTMGGHVDTTTFVGAALRNVQGLTQEPTLHMSLKELLGCMWLKETWLLLQSYSCRKCMDSVWMAREV